MLLLCHVIITLYFEVRRLYIDVRGWTKSQDFSLPEQHEGRRHLLEPSTLKVKLCKQKCCNVMNPSADKTLICILTLSSWIHKSFCYYNNPKDKVKR